MRAFLAAIAFLLAMPALAVEGEEAKQVTPEGLFAFQQLVLRAKQGDLGPDVAEANFTFSFQGLGSDGAIRFELFTRDGRQTGVFLLRPPRDWPTTSPRHFIIFADQNLDAARLARLNAVLDEVFPTSPWWYPPDTPPDRYVPHPVGKWRVFVGFAFLQLSTLAGLRYLLRSGPRAPETNHA